jgi:hypothetical protein
MTISGDEVPAIPDVLIEDADLRNLLLALKTIAEIREGRHTDKNQRFITYYELVDYLAGNDQLVVEATTGGHDHSTLYSVLSHDHQGVYAEIVDVEGVYALVVHDHEGMYAALKHQHDELYSKIGHNHEGLYADVFHEHHQWDEIEARSYFNAVIHNQIL